jgi:hypothetical protein
MAKEMAHEWCERGATVTFEAMPGLEHITAQGTGPLADSDWLLDRLHGVAAAPGCRVIDPT